MAANPFRIGGPVIREFFTDRAPELKRIRQALSEPQAKLLVYGPRRMGKTSAILQAAARLPARHRVVLADLSTASGIADMATRLLQAASQALGSSPTTLKDLLTGLSFGVSLTPDPVSGSITLSLDVDIRRAPLEEQRQTFGQVLDTLDRIAAKRKVTLGVVLDEFQEIHRFGGEEAEWHLRGVLQRHRHLAYVLAGSKESLIADMVGKNRAFYKLLEPLHFGPIPMEHLSRWIEDRLEKAGIHSPAIGRSVVELVGPRTRDIVQLARSCYEVGAAKGKLATADVSAAFQRVVAEESDQFLTEWERLTGLQQNVLRALAAGGATVFSRETRERFSLGDTGSVASAISALSEQDLITRSAAGYRFDNPFFRGWVITNALPDVGILRNGPPAS